MSIKDLHQALTDDITANIAGITAIKTHRPLTDLEGSEELQVFVVPAGVAKGQLLNKTTFEDLLVFNIGLIKKIDAGTDAEVEAQIESVIEQLEDIRKFYTIRSISGAESDYKHHDVKSIAIYDYEILDDDSQLISAVEITFKEWRQ